MIKMQSQPVPSPKNRQPDRKGSALVIVLSSLAFMAALALAFLASVGSELRSSKRYADGVSVQLLAQSAFSLVQSQIKEATKGYPGDSTGTTLAWASQPGMIRTYTESGGKGDFYRLYSWDDLVGSGEFDPSAPANAIPLTGAQAWYNQKGVYTDLNQPVTISGQSHFPVVDGNGIKSLTKTPSGGATAAYWGYDSNTDSLPDVDGFSVDSTKINYNPGSPFSPANQPVPMPVKWLYVLADGEMKAATYLSENEARIAGATEDNPIVGRVAFWTDDESSKININTASEGVYWDTPRVKSSQEDQFKVFQPVNGEYQRYPGHPAMTSLSTVIKYPAGWTPGTPPPALKLGDKGEAVSVKFTQAQWTDYQWAQKLYGIVPRVETGGSNAGTVQSAMLLSGSPPPALILDADRLYASVDELAFKPLLSGTDRVSNNQALANLGVLNKAMLERAKFFLTASSRAPDVNLFNQPRVCMWPLHATNDNNHRTAFDRLIAFCSTFGGYAYYFERSNPNSPTDDLFLNRNRRLLAYLRNLAGTGIPGFGGNFNAKYASDKDQIFTEIFDYIRCTNLRDPLLVDKTDETKSTSYTVGALDSPWKTTPLPGKGTNGMGQVVPIVDAATNTRGFGRFVTAQGASVLFIGQVNGDAPLVPLDLWNQPPVGPLASASQVPDAQADPVTGRPLPYWSLPLGNPPSTMGTLLVDKVLPGKMRIQALFLPQFFSPAVGASWLRRNFKWSVDLDLKVNGNPLDFPANVSSGAAKLYTVNQQPKDETGFGDQAGLNMVVESAGANLLSNAMDVPKGDMTFTGQATVKIYAPDSTLLQTIGLNFNGPDCEVPSLAFDHVANKADNGFPKEALLPYMNYRSFIPSTGRYNAGDPSKPIAVQGGRFVGALKTSNAAGFIMDGDAIRSVRLISGDARLAAAQQNPPAALFEANPATAKLMGAHSFLTGYGHSYYGAGLGRLVQDAGYSGVGITTANRNTTDDGPQPGFFNSGFAFGSDCPLNGVEAGSNLPYSGGVRGDWDNGPFAVRDGPYINKPDEGDVGGGGSAINALKEPYFWKIKDQSGGNINTSLFSPNRMIPSPVTLGSLSSGVKANRPWQTLLFRPEPGHPGASSPPDHLLLELFSMPVVEPYAVSEPLSTAGRINMNYQIVPFTYINRDTGIRALLKAEKVTAINNTQAGIYKRYNPSASWEAPQYSVRFDVNAEETLKGFRQRFDAKDIFRSASEICGLHIVPKDDPDGSYPGSSLDTYATMPAYWNDHKLTGDNSKERIYATLYPRLTTKSNTFTIYTRVQTLKKIKDDRPDVWTEGRDQVTGQYRGYQTVERFVDPNESGIPDYASGSSVPLGDFYKTRVLATKQFGP